MTRQEIVTAIETMRTELKASAESAEYKSAGNDYMLAILAMLGLPH
jgi:hypothetical protein